MASSRECLHYILEQFSELEEISYREMMGEFILYYRGKIIGGIYDDRLLVKPVKSAISYMPDAIYELPYAGAKEMLLVITAILTAIFLAGRYGWKLAGFRACQGAGISSVEVRDKAVHITGFYPGSFPEGCCGYYAREQDGKLYVGLRFSAIFGFFETGDFDANMEKMYLTVTTDGRINEREK